MIIIEKFVEYLEFLSAYYGFSGTIIALLVWGSVVVIVTYTVFWLVRSLLFQSYEYKGAVILKEYHADKRTGLRFDVESELSVPFEIPNTEGCEIVIEVGDTRYRVSISREQYDSLEIGDFVKVNFVKKRLSGFFHS